jgi:hypothetical protein
MVNIITNEALQHMLNNNGEGLKIAVLQPDYSTTDVDYKNYDPPRILNNLLPNAVIENIFLNKLTTYKQLETLKKNKYNIYVNLCEGYLNWSVPSIDVIHSLDALQLPYTGPTAMLYDPQKTVMKYVAYTEGVRTPNYAIIDDVHNIIAVTKDLHYPLFVKPAKAGDSLGVDAHSLVHNEKELAIKINQIFEEYAPLLIEEYIDGREFTCLVIANAENKNDPIILQPIEYIFPKGYTFKTYSLKTAELHNDTNHIVTDKVLAFKIKEATKKIFKSFGGVGYARLDFRYNNKEELFFLEINFTCSVFYSQGYEGSADYILQQDGFGQQNFLKAIIKEGIIRYNKQQKKYSMRGNSIAGYGIYANQLINAGTIVFKGEEKAQRIVTKNWVQKHWNENDKKLFAHYAYPISAQVYILWSNNPTDWAPQNHSCNANCAYEGLNVIALKNINTNEELTLDYATFLNENIEPFTCTCGAVNCRGLIKGTAHNVIT